MICGWVFRGSGVCPICEAAGPDGGPGEESDAGQLVAGAAHRNQVSHGGQSHYTTHN